MKPQPKPEPPPIVRAEHDAYVEKLLRSKRKAHALNWLRKSKQGALRCLAGSTGAKTSIALVEELIGLGALAVTAAEIKKRPSGSQWTEKLVVGLPAAAEQRKSIFAWCKRRRKDIGYSPQVDTGESHLYILLD